MNCIQAQAMLAVYRELKYEEVEITELDVHLEYCASCRQELARYTFIGEQVRSLPVIESPPEMHAKLMRALAHEQLQLMQRSAPGKVPTPEFLKPYLQEHAQSTHVTDSIAAFSTADTGPIPIISVKSKQHPRSHMSQFAVLGLAAAFLMVLMMGGITSLLLLAHDSLQTAIHTNGVNSVNHFSDLTDVKAKYKTNTLYQHVVSAVADREYIYFTAYSDVNNNAWMLEQLNRTTMKSTPLLTTASASPLIALGSSNGWLVWLQFDELKPAVHHRLPHDGSIYLSPRPWSLHYLSLTPPHATTLAKSSNPVTLLKGIFDRNIAPDWLSTPVQGIWFISDSLLVAMIDQNGISHLLRYELSTNDKPSAKAIASVSQGHIFTSPTANSDGTQIYWSEEWMGEDGNLHSNIWIQEVLDTMVRSHAGLVADTKTTKDVFRSDGVSFHPQVVNNTLFLLSTSDATSSIQSSPIPSTPSLIPTAPRVDMSVYRLPLDASVRGTVVMIPLEGDALGTPTSLGNLGQSSSLQAGTNFVLWQDDNGYKMYDVQTASDVTVGTVLDNANFLAVNGNTAVWTVENGTNASNSTGSIATLLAFNWPK